MDRHSEFQGIRRTIAAVFREQIEDIAVFAAIDSTNDYLLSSPRPSSGNFRMAVAEHQTAGRGQHGRPWRSTPASGVCLSLAYTFAAAPTSLPCLTLAVGARVASSLQEIGVRGIGLKWPNDLFSMKGKLGGILTETVPVNLGQTTAVVGVGLNVDLHSARQNSAHDSDLTNASDLRSCMDVTPSRKDLATLLIDSVCATIVEFDRCGFSGFADEWREFDRLLDRKVRVTNGDSLSEGVCCGIDDDGALLLKTSDGGQRIVSGSVRAL